VSDEQALKKEQIADWLEQRPTKELIGAIEEDLDDLRTQIENIQTDDVKVMRLQEAIKLRRLILQQPDQWVLEIIGEEEFSDLYDQVNP
jgi:hypothetical protein